MVQGDACGQWDHGLVVSCTQLFRTLASLEAAQEAATALKFNNSIVKMVRTVINGMKHKGITRYRGAHLR